MNFEHDRNRSAELLRLALPLMSRQEAGLHPVSYAVWYEYVAGGSRALNQRIDALTAAGARLTEESTLALFREFIAEIDEESARRITEGFEHALTRVARSTEQAGDDTARFGTTLDECLKGLAAGDQHVVPGGTLDTLVRGTSQMLGAMATLKERLDQSRDEINALQREIKRTREEALTDGLTGLANRRAFDRVLFETVPAQRGDERVAPSLLIADIDHFKRVNDTYGHLFGDQVLRAVAQVLKSNTKRRDTVARYGGEEFAILLPDTPLDGAKVLAEGLRRSIECSRIKRRDCAEPIESITISFGVARHRPGESPGDLVERADGALYASKNAGRNRVTVAAEA